MRRKTVGIVVATVCLLSSERARADFDFQLSTTFAGGWLRQTPTFTSKPISTTARDMGEGNIRTGQSLAMLGLGGDVEVTLDDRWRVPLLGGNVWWPVGSYDATVTSFDGSIASVRPWSARRGDILLPGFGRRWKHRRNMWGVAARTGISFMTMDGSVAAGAETVPLELLKVTFLAQIEIEACRRIDPTVRACLQVVPRLYEHELLNGVTFGLRMEWGR